MPRGLGTTPPTSPVDGTSTLAILDEGSSSAEMSLYQPSTQPHNNK